MATPPRKRTLSAAQRRALKLLASSPHGANEELLIHGHGFTRRMLAGLIRGELATVQREVIKAGGKAIEVIRFRITPTGRQALGKAN
jgi:hypothetical protein